MDVEKQIQTLFQKVARLENMKSQMLKVEGAVSSLTRDTNSNMSEVFHRLAEVEKTGAVTANEVEHLRNDINGFLHELREHMKEEAKAFQNYGNRLTLVEKLTANWKSRAQGFVAAFLFLGGVIGTCLTLLWKWLTNS